MIQCTNCGKVFNRSPANMSRSARGEHFCGWDCWMKYKKEHYGVGSAGMVPREKRVEMAVESLERGVEYKTIDIAGRVPPSRAVIEPRALVRYLGMRDDMKLVNRGVWVRV